MTARCGVYIAAGIVAGWVGAVVFLVLAIETEHFEKRLASV